MRQPKRHQAATARMTQPPPGDWAERGSPLFTLLLIAWFIGAYGLVIWGVVSDRGPFAFLLAWQRAVFGGASVVLGALAGAVIVFWGPALLGRAAARLWPASARIARYNSLMRRAMMSRGQAAARARAVWDGMDDVTRRRTVTRRRNAALACAATLLVATVAANAVISRSANADAGRPLRRVLLGAGPLTLRADETPWVVVEGAQPLTDAVMQRSYAIRGDHYRDYYTPLVPAGWQSGLPVPLVELDQTLLDSHDPADQPDPPGAIEGELSAGGPRPDIAALFRRYGYAVDAATLVLTRTDLHGVIPGEDPFLAGFIWYMGGMCTAMALLVAAFAERQRRRI